jgi:hypothetical protein
VTVFGRRAIGFFFTVAVFARYWAAPKVFDDAFISFRYSEHLANGLGLVFNPADGPLEGFTNLSWVVLNAAAMKLGFDPLAFSQSLGLACLAACMLVLLRVSVPVAFLFGACVLTMPGFIDVTGSGLETPLASLAGLLLAYEVLTESRSLLRLFGISLLLVTTRPDGVILLAAATLAFAWRSGRRLKRELPLVVALAVPPLLLAAFRFAYFGELAPNTYFAKSADVSSWAAGFAYWVGFAKNSPHVPALIVLWLTALVARARRPTPLDVFGVTTVALYVVYVAKVGGDFMFYRFAFQALPLVFFFLAAAVAQLGIRTSVVGTALVSVVVVLGANRPVVEEKSYGMQSVETMNHFVPIGREAGLALREALPPETKISTTLAGTVPYFSKLFTVDEWGLNDKAIARQKSEPIPLGGRGHLKRPTPEYLDARGVNLELGHPAICDCDRLCDAAFPQVYLRLEGNRCLRMRYRVKTPALTTRFCSERRFIPLHVDCSNERIDFDWQSPSEDAPSVPLTPLRATALPPDELLRHAHGPAFGKSASPTALIEQSALLGVRGPVLNSFHGGDATTGWIAYPLPPEVRRVTASVGGGDCTKTFIGLVANGRVIARACGQKDERLRTVALDVPAERGPITFVAVDQAHGGWGHLLVADVELWSSAGERSDTEQSRR